jgi:inner membrane protein involved in colicin E2 resistance
MSLFDQPNSSSLTANSASHSLGAKFFLLFLLAILMSLSGFFVDNLAQDRAEIRGATTTYNNNGVAVPPHTVLGIKLADSYRSTERSLKYITLFLGLVFLTYFLFEITTGKRVHPGQYALVGVAQTVFYLLLLSLSEHIGFDFSFLIAGSATVLLFSINAEWVFLSRKLGLRALAVFSLLYAFIYVLLRLEDYALLIGALTSFTAVAITMYLTRRVDWYRTAANQVPSSAVAAATAPEGRDSWLD